MRGMNIVIVTLAAPTGWAGVADRDTQVLIDARLTPNGQVPAAAQS